jgi:hypothetical protein
MYKRLLISAALLLLYLFIASGQKADSTTLITKTLISSETRQPYSDVIDTSFNALTFYNPVHYYYLSSIFTGNSGNAAFSNFFPEQTNSYPFLFALPYQVYLHNPYNTPHFNTRKPFTELKYLSSGSRDNSEQILSALHTQNVNQYANLGLFYDLIASKGYYIDQNTGFNRLSLYGSYEKDQYSMFASANFNSLKSQENGGLTNISDFLNQSGDVVNFDMQLDDADSRFRYYTFFLTQKISTPRFSADTLKTEKKGLFALQHSVNYSRYAKSYKDLISASDTLSFYRNNYYLINETDDSASYQNLENRLDLNAKFARGTQELNAYVRHELQSFKFFYPSEITLVQDTATMDTVIRKRSKSNFNDISIGGFYRGLLGNWEYKASGEIFLTGYRIGDVNLEGRFVRYFSSKTRSVTLVGKISSLKPDYYLSNYYSSHFDWRNTLVNTDRISACMVYSGKKAFKTDFSLNYSTGLVYFDTLAMPRQYTDQLLVMALRVDKRFNWGPVHHEHQILVQKATAEVVRLPLLAYRNTSWYEHALFKNALFVQFGVKFYFFSEYFAHAYMPATGVFYNQDEQRYGNYPFLDGFLNLKIKRTRISLQYTNALAGIAGYNYFMAHRHPNFGGSLKFGVAWTFYD